MIVATRRQFLQWTGAGALASMVVGGVAAKDSFGAGARRAKSFSQQPFHLAIASYTFRKFPLDKVLAMTARVGLRRICLKDFHLPLGSTPAQIAEAAAKVKAAGIELYGCGVVTMRKPADVDRAFEYATAAGMRVIVAAPSPEMLPRIDEKVKKYDIRLAIHNHGPGDKFFPLPDVAYAKIKGLDRRIGLCIDIGHTVRAGGDPSRAAEQFADRLFDVHIKDVSEAAAKGRTVEAGRGVIDLPRFLRTLKKTGYAGNVAFEYEKDAGDPLPGLAESVGYVRGVLAAI
jgi:inosose dehydratase